jgi:hypothetical protein
MRELTYVLAEAIEELVAASVVAHIEMDHRHTPYARIVAGARVVTARQALDTLLAQFAANLAPRRL